MPSLPRKSVKGSLFKKWAIASIDQLIDYLSSNWLQAGDGINIRRTPSGTIIEAQQRKGEPQVLSGGGGTTVTTGFPDFFSASSIVVNDTQTYTLTEDMWLVGIIESSNYSGSTASYFKMNLQEDISSTPLQKTLFSIGTESTAIFRSTFVSIPLKSGLILSFTKDYLGMTSSLTLYPCT